MTSSPITSWQIEGKKVEAVTDSILFLFNKHCAKHIVVQSLSHPRLFAAPRTAARQAPLSSTLSRSLLRFMSIESVMLSNHPILYCPLLLLPSFFPNIRVFSNELALHVRWPKYWSFSISPSYIQG